jgi:hypothetical protein
MGCENKSAIPIEPIGKSNSFSLNRASCPDKFPDNITPTEFIPITPPEAFGRDARTS